MPHSIARPGSRGLWGRASRRWRCADLRLLAGIPPGYSVRGRSPLTPNGVMLVSGRACTLPLSPRKTQGKMLRSVTPQAACCIWRSRRLGFPDNREPELFLCRRIAIAMICENPHNAGASIRFLARLGLQPTSSTMSASTIAATRLPSVSEITQLQIDTVAAWHQGPIENPYDGFKQLVCTQHEYNYRLWHQEDIARSPTA